MIGSIESYDAESQSGIIKSELVSYPFNLDDWIPKVSPDVDDEVSFNVDDSGIAKDINLVGAILAKPEGVKSRYIAGALALFLGFAGVHRFYLGFYKIGLAQIALTAATQGYGVLWGFIEAVLIFTGHIYKDAKGRPLK
ncbi:MAG: TM2 domain-containing protein [Methylococcales bacterium]|nr:TM2 domain-containing protein [Methylococcales bacterium]